MRTHVTMIFAWSESTVSYLYSGFAPETATSFNVGAGLKCSASKG